MQEEKTYYGDNVVYLKMLTPEEYANLENPVPSSVHCFPVKNNEVLFTINPRGLDIIGGHIEKGETAEQAMHREGLEEGCIEIKSMKLIGAIQVDNRDNPKAEALGYPKIGYQLFYAVDNFTMLPFVADFECTDRKFVNKEDIPKQHHKWLNVHNDLLKSLDKVVKKHKNSFKI